MNPKDLPLEPLIAPAPVNWWPLAPIWWILIGLILLILIAGLIYSLKNLKRKPSKLPVISIDLRRTAAIAELASLEKPYAEPAGPWLEQINILLKRLCAAHYPTQNTHTLLGNKWLDFLDAQCPEAMLKQYPVLVEGLYRDNCQLDKQTIDALNTAIEKWITDHV